LGEAGGGSIWLWIIWSCGVKTEPAINHLGRRKKKKVVPKLGEETHKKRGEKIDQERTTYGSIGHALTDEKPANSSPGGPNQWM